MYDIIPTNKEFNNYNYFLNNDNNKKELNGKFTIITSSGHINTSKMFDNNDNSYWESENLFIEKIDDPVLSNTVNDLNELPCLSDDYLKGTCINRYTGLNNITGYTRYLSNDPSNNNIILKNKITTKTKGETIEINLPNLLYIYELNLEFVEGYAPKRYQVYAFDEDIKKNVLLGLQFNVNYQKTQDNLAFYPTKKYKKITIVFNALNENTSIRITKLQLKGDKTLKTAHNSKYTLGKENFSNIDKKVRFSNTKYVYEYDKNNKLYSDLLIPLAFTTMLFLVYSNKKI
jgi:hypothetical protein